jgi:enediyne polyketide synthase
MSYSSVQDAELILLSDQNGADLQLQIDRLLTTARGLSLTEFTDMVIHLAQTRQEGPARAAIVASDPLELIQRLEKLQGLLANNVIRHRDMQSGIFLGEDHTPPRIGFLFTGQGAPPYLDGGLLRQRFDFVDDIYTLGHLSADENGGETRIDQPAIIGSSLAALRVLQKLGITATIGIGHSLGELIALHWAGAIDEITLFHLTRVRADAMSSGQPTGAMATLRAAKEQVEALLAGENVFIAGITAPQLIVISGDAGAVASVLERAEAKKIPFFYLPVPYAFHSPLIAENVRPYAEELTRTQFQPLQRTVISTVTGMPLDAHTNLATLLHQQVMSAVQLRAAVDLAAQDLDLFIEVGPGKLISGFASQCTQVPVLAVDAGGPSMKDLLQVVGAVFALGVAIQSDVLFADRFSHPFDLQLQSRFL